MAVWTENVWSHPTARLAVAFIIGAFIGIVVSFTVNCTLVEISINEFFASYFGILFLIIASLILWRVKTGDHPKPYLLVSFALVVMVSGFLCFILERHWFVHLSYVAKIPMYTILGVAVTFALLFSIIDLMNLCCGYCQSDNSKPLVETEQQVYLVVGTAIAMGMTFGLIFGLLDVEDAKLSQLRVELLREESICYPIGAILGGLAAAANQWLRDKHDQYKFDPVHDDELDEDY